MAYFFPAFQKLNEVLSKTVLKLFPDVTLPEEVLEIPKHEGFGDFSTAISLKLAKQFGKVPMEVAKMIISKIELPEEYDAPQILPPGFINFSLKKDFLANFSIEVAKNPKVLRPNLIKDKTVVTDISHPNVAKPMGVHHLLSTVIGDSLSRLFAYVGYKVVRDNYLGDWGTQFGKLIYAYRTWGDEKVVAKDPIPELLKLYVKFHEEAEKEPGLEDKGRAEFKKLEDGDAENKKLWKWVVELSKREFYKIWDLLGVKFDVINGESFYEDKMQEILEAGLKQKLFTTGERGALICEFPEEKFPPAVIKKSDGATLYATRDLARIKYCEKTWHPDLMIMVVDMAQTMYFKQLFCMAEKMKLTKASNVHIAFGRMSFPDRRMSTRKGNIILLEELIDEIIELARKVVEEKNPELDKKKKDEVAKMVGLGALKFAVLVQNRETDITFTWEKMLSLEGESAPYVQYAYARAKSILRKGITEKVKSSKYILTEKEEINLSRMLPKFSLVVAQSVKDFKPNHLAKYLCDLASQFNSFYSACSVLQAEDKDVCNTRLTLVSAVAEVLRIGLDLLGIQAPEEM